MLGLCPIKDYKLDYKLLRSAHTRATHARTLRADKYIHTHTHTHTQL